jgi:hypothetical protein
LKECDINDINQQTKMKRNILLYVLALTVLASCQKADEPDTGLILNDNNLKAEFQGFSMQNAKAGIQLLTGEDEKETEWFPSGKPEILNTDRTTPIGEATDISMTWAHEDGYVMSWTVSRLKNASGFTLRASVTNLSSEPVRLKKFILCQTPQNGIVCEGDPAGWWLLSPMNNTRQGANLSQVLPSRLRLKEQKVYGYDKYKDNDPRNSDGHWRFFEEVISLYRESDRKGIVIGPVGPGVSHVKLNCRVDAGNILLEVVSSMDEVLLEPSGTRVSEEVLILEKPYHEALTTLFSWMAETHGARKEREPIFGWCSWYDRYTNIDEEHILRITETVKAQRDVLPLQVIQVDHGWHGPFGDWDENEMFSLGMDHIAEKIQEAGALPGIWMSPVVCDIEKPKDWFQNPEGGFLDPTHPEVEKFILSTVRAAKEKGYRYFKFDYNYLQDFRPYNQKMTHFEVMRHLFELYREAIGEESYMLACGAPTRPVIGIADANRIAWDAIARWKSFPLADDGIPTLPTDIYDGIYNIAGCAIMNNIIYHNDPDVAYMLPRAETHILQGPKEDFDPELHGLKWPGLQTWNSYVGLLGGMALVSEPLYDEKYRQPEAIRMLEIMNPPSPDKGWSMNGDIDPWSRQFGFVTEKPWGRSASVALWNKEDESADLFLDMHSLGSLGDRFHTWSFWEEKYLGVVRGSFSAKDVPAHGCRLLRLTQVSENTGTPLIVGSTLHISMGSAEFKSVIVANGEMVIELTDGGTRNGKIFLHYPGSLSVRQADGCGASIISEGQDIHILSLFNRVRNGNNTIRLTI